MKVSILGNMGAYPAYDRACSGYLISAGCRKILIDCGSGILAKVMDSVGITGLDAVILSHLHWDHMSDILPMQYALQFASKNLDVYLPSSPKVSFDAIASCRNFVLHTFDAGSKFSFDEAAVDFCPVPHPCESYAVRINCKGRILVYTGDAKLTPQLIDFCSGADLLLADAAQSTEGFVDSANPHMSVGQGKELMQKSRAKRMLITHFSPLFDTSEEILRAGLECAECREYEV